MAEGRPALSVVVVTHDMERELPRTLQSLSASYQRNLQPVDYEIVVVDNGSRVPARVPPRSYAEARIALHRVGDPSPSPAAAANLGITAASADLIGYDLGNVPSQVVRESQPGRVLAGSGTSPLDDGD